MSHQKLQIYKKVKIIAPGGKNIQVKFSEVMKRIDLLFKKYSIDYNISKDIMSFKEDIFPFYANSLEYRVNDICEAIESKDVAIIWCYRGGYGSAELVDILIKKYQDSEIKNKILIGYSDITSLHLFVNSYFNLPSIHGSLISELNDVSLKDLFETLNQPTRSYQLSSLNEIRYDNDNNSKIIGGNFTVFLSNIGTATIKNDSFFDNKILLLEDVNEPPYAICRALVHLSRLPIFNRLKAIIFGSFTDSEDDDLTQKIIKDFANKLSIPVFSIKDIGHIDNNRNIWLNSNIAIEGNNLIVNRPIKQDLLG